MISGCHNALFNHDNTKMNKRGWNQTTANRITKNAMMDSSFILLVSFFKMAIRLAIIPRNKHKNPTPARGAIISAALLLINNAAKPKIINRMDHKLKDLKRTPSFFKT